MANTEQNDQQYTVTAEVTFSITATSIPMAYKLFTDWMAHAFNNSFEGVDKPIIVPSSFEGMAIVREFDDG
jgi:hypothetical protein